MQKWICKICGAVVKESAVLTAHNPFMPHAKISGCPGCKNVGTLEAKCEIKNCTEPSTHLKQTLKNQKWVCKKHHDE